ncbi:Phosphate-binding protein PstS [Corynebacterium pseudotuberculosis]|uniref:phosphate ABC transporter substrate-binding protein PstS n=1 Tax=Corynebacterium pseudotuberculosis TaxID=1719 RepID=UPI00065E5670|nr:phosphate ABC transporter substrate-binding protein PstS [Corynebacterium pseudotuberculosis]AKP09332.1 Phosphate-binding protein PstS [Corynebacterium pseudotuberculosis]
MNLNLKRSTTALSIVCMGAVALSACSETSSSSGAGASTSEVSGLNKVGGELVGEGASSQQNAMDYFNIKYQEAVSGASLAYTASGSGFGRKNFIAGQVAFGGSDSPLSAEQVEKAKGRCQGNDAWHLPFVIGPVAVAYHLNGVDHLNLSAATVAKIFKGEIKKWNDAAIAQENTGVQLPDSDIKVVYRSDESGTSDNFQKFLKAASPENWSTEGQAFPTAVGSGANGSNGVATEVSNIDGAITYVEAGFAKQQKLGIAAIDFGHGPVQLNPDSVGVALDHLTFKTQGNDMVVDSSALFAMKEKDAYPLVLTTYEIVCSAGYDQTTRDRVKDFLSVALNSQDQELADLGYIPVKGTHRDRLEKAVKAIS